MVSLQQLSFLFVVVEVSAHPRFISWHCQLPSVLWHCWLGGRKGIRPVKNGGGWRWALVSPDGVVPSQMVCVSASVDLSLRHNVRRFSSGTGSPGWSRKKGRKTVVWCGSWHCDDLVCADLCLIVVWCMDIPLSC